MTHGRPGMLYTQMADGTAGGSTEQAVSLNLKTFLGSGWMDREWLTHNRKVLREAARKAFAPDARIILWACLSGANFDPPMSTDQEQAEVPINIGDQFIAALVILSCRKADRLMHRLASWWDWVRCSVRRYERERTRVAS
jgi:hypothetical protein